MFSSLGKSSLAAMTIFAAVFFLAWMLLDVGGSTGVMLLIIYFVIWGVLAYLVSKSEEEGESLHHLIYLLNKSHHLKAADYIIMVIIVAGVKFFLGLMFFTQIWPLIVAFFFGIAANSRNSEAKKPWPINRDKNDDADAADASDAAEASDASDAAAEPEDVIVNTPQQTPDSRRVYDWLMDPARGIKLSGHMELPFSQSYIDWLRAQNPYCGVASMNEEAVTLMFNKMKQNQCMLSNVRKIANYINRECSKKLIFEYDRLQFVLDFVQEPNIKYIHDDECEEICHATQYVRYPDETLFDKRGDCDCKTMLAAMIFWVMGYNVIFLLSSKLQHAALGLEYDSHWNKMLPKVDLARNVNIDIHDIVCKIGDKRYIFCETTGDGFRIGSITSGQKIDDFESYVIFNQE